MRRPSRLAALGLAAGLVLPPPALARPFTLDDLLAAEEFGQVGFDPTGRWLVFEVLRGQAVSGPFDIDTYTDARRGRLWVVDLRAGGPPWPLVESPAGEGVTAGPFAPDGQSLAVMRLRGRTWELGVVRLADRKLTWLGVTPELGELGQTVAWRSSTELVVAARPADDPPFKLRYGWQARERLPRLWAEAARGERPALTVVGSGRFLAVRPKAIPGGLWLINLSTGVHRRLAEGEFYDLEISPDGSRVAAMQLLEDVQAGPDTLLRVASPSRRRNLLVADLTRGGVTEPCADCDLTTHLIAWSPRSDRVLVYGRRGGEPWSRARLMTLGEAGPAEPSMAGLRISLDYTSEGFEIPPATWLDDQPAAYAVPVGGGRADWYRLGPDGPQNLTGRLPEPTCRLIAHGDHDLTVQASGAAWRVAASGLRRELASGGPAPRTGLGLSNRLKVNAPPRIGWTLDTGGRTLLATDGATQAIPRADGPIVEAVPARSALAVVRRQADQTLTLDLAQAGRLRRLMTLNLQFAGVSFVHPIPLRGTAPDGQPVTHWLFLPPDLPPRVRPPLVVTLYPGLSYDLPPAPYGNGVGRFPANPEILAAAGFAVLAPSLPRDPSSPEPAQGLADQILAAVDLAATTGQVDAERLALYGHSFGGYAALMAATQSPRIKAVVAGAAPSDLASLRGQIHPHYATVPEDGLNLNAVFGWSELGQGHLGASPWQGPERYRRNSPLFQVDRLNCPVLLIHGDGDFVRVEQAQELFSALYRQDKDAELVTVHGQGHLVTSPADLKATYDIAIGWLRQVLGAP